MKNKVIIIGGATASGKTALSLKMAAKFDGEIISADSRQIYIGMDIGTAKVTKRNNPPKDTTNLYKTPIEYNSIPHYLIDIVYPTERYTLFDFKTQAYELISEMFSRNKTPIIVGGTGLYIDAIVNNYQHSKANLKEDLGLKSQLEQEAKLYGKDHMYQKLQQLSPLEAKNLHPNNIYLVLRALEFAILNQGKSKTASVKKAEPPFEYELILTDLPRQQLYYQIETRIDQQIEQGLITETKNLIEQYGEHLPALTSLGYKELNSYLKGEQDYQTAINLFKQHTRNYAKRQLTWFRRYQKNNSD